jgi:hypothetical protein
LNQSLNAEIAGLKEFIRMQQLSGSGSGSSKRRLREEIKRKITMGGGRLWFDAER